MRSIASQSGGWPLRWLVSPIAAVLLLAWIRIDRTEGLRASNELSRFPNDVITRWNVLSREDLWKSVLPSMVGGSGILTLPSSSRALSPTEAQRQYDTYAATYDQLDGADSVVATNLLGLDEARNVLIRSARGHVLEIGAGTGLNLPKYNGMQISSLTLVDVSDGMLQMARTKLDTLENLRNIPVRFIQADMTSELVTRFGREAFDTVVDSFSLCVLGNDGARQCLEQISQVVKTKSSGGKILLLENSRSSNPLLGLYQDATATAAANAGGKGCLYNQDVTRLIRSVPTLQIVDETEYAAGLFRAYEVCVQRN
jgi:methyltransferase OMS1, mitochondrial